MSGKVELSAIIVNCPLRKLTRGGLAGYWSASENEPPLWAGLPCGADTDAIPARGAAGIPVPLGALYGLVTGGVYGLATYCGLGCP